MIVLIVIIAVLVMWTLYGLWGANTYKRGLGPATRALSDSIIADRKAFIIEDGRRKHEAWQKAHPLRGRLSAYRPIKYFRNNQLNTKRYPY